MKTVTKVTPKSYLVTAKTPAELVSSLDETLSVWKCELGFYWYDKFDGQMSEKFFRTERSASLDCRDLVFEGKAS